MINQTTHDEGSHRPGCVEALHTMHHELSRAIDERDCERIEELVTERGQLIDDVLEWNQNNPLPQGDRERLFAADNTLSTRVALLHDDIGGELRDVMNKLKGLKKYARSPN
jgi:hypothetical protein